MTQKIIVPFIVPYDINVQHEIDIFSNRIEILSRGTIAPAQTLEGFYLGESVPVNEKLSDIFAQLRISDKSGRGVLKIIENYSKNAFEFRDNSIVVTIPFNANRKIGNKVGNKVGNIGDVTRKHGLNSTRERILSEMRHNPNITKAELIVIMEIKKTILFITRIWFSFAYKGIY